jgi:hypothetical protein
MVPFGAYIGDSIVIEKTDPISESSHSGGEIAFDLGSVPMIADGTFNDLEISYWSPDSCDRDTWIYNWRTRSWVQIGYHNAPGSGCFMSPMPQYHLLSGAGIDAYDVVSNKGVVRLMRGPTPEENESSETATLWGEATIRALRINPDYHTLSMAGREPNNHYGLTWDGEALWVSDSWKLTRITGTGEVLASLATTWTIPEGLGFDGAYFWVNDLDSWHLAKITLAGRELGGWWLPGEYHAGITCGAGRVWVGEQRGPYSRIFGIDPDIRWPGDRPVVTDTLLTPGLTVDGLAWDGTNLIVACDEDSLYVMDLEGGTVEAHDLPVKYIRDIAWDGESVWILNRGPAELTSRDMVITRFRLR